MSVSTSETRPVVLLAEDEPLVRMYNADVLDEAGFRVVEAGNADEAIALFEARPDIRIVVTDVEMPGSRNGFDLARYVADKRPLVGVLIVSGRVRPRDDELPDESRFLAKPYSPDELLREVEATLTIHEQMRRPPPG